MNTFTHNLLPVTNTFCRLQSFPVFSLPSVPRSFFFSFFLTLQLYQTISITSRERGGWSFWLRGSPQSESSHAHIHICPPFALFFFFLFSSKSNGHHLTISTKLPLWLHYHHLPVFHTSSFPLFSLSFSFLYSVDFFIRHAHRLI